MFYKNPNVLTKQQRDDVELRPVIEALQRDVKEEPKCGSQHLLYQIWKQLNFSSDGVLTRTFAHKNSAICVPVIPASLRSELLERFHGSAHMVVGETHDLLRVNAYWPGMETDVQKFELDL